jgi:hypothetical protein
MCQHVVFLECSIHCCCACTYPLSPPVCHVEEEIPAALLLGRKTDGRRKIWVLHHPLLQLDVPAPVAVVKLLGGDFLQNITRELVEDGEQRLGREACHFRVQRGHVGHRVRGGEREVGWNHGLDVGFDKGRAEGRV